MLVKRLYNPEQLIAADHDLSRRRKIENQRIALSLVTDTVDGPLVGNKGRGEC